MRSESLGICSGRIFGFFLFLFRALLGFRGRVFSGNKFVFKRDSVSVRGFDPSIHKYTNLMELQNSSKTIKFKKSNFTKMRTNN